ncbi:MAG: DsbA family protein [Anaerolineales bacterium]
MAESGLGLLRETHAVKVDWRAFELRPKGSAPMPADYRERIRQGWPRVQQIARERFNVEMTRPEEVGEPGKTLLAHVGAKFAITHGQGEAYHHAVFRAHWQEMRDIGDVNVLAEIATGLGLDEAAFRAALDDPLLHSAVMEDEEWAYRNGLGGVPAFIFGNRYLVSGAQPAEVLREVAERCIAEGLIKE